MSGSLFTRPAFVRTEPVEITAGARVRRLADALADGAGAAAIKAFWAEARQTGTPLVEPDPAGDPDHRAVTFLWRDHPVAGAAAERVVLHANKFTDYDDLDACSLVRLAGTDVWHRTFRLRADWRAGYALGPLPPSPEGAPPPTGRAARGQLMRFAEADPLNRHPMVDHLDGTTTSVAELDAAPPQGWVDVPGDPARLSCVPLESRHLGGPRTMWVHRPPVPPPAGGHPLLVLLDGEIWARRYPVGPTLDHLIGDGAIPPMAAVLVDGTDPAQRAGDLLGNPDLVAFLVDEALPRAAEEVALTDDPGRTIIAGQSFGGLAAAHAARSRPDRFGNVLAQSGSFWWPGDPRHEYGTAWLTREHVGPADPPVRHHLQIGLQEWGMPPIVRRLRDALEAQGHPVQLREYRAGHDRASWRGGLVDGLVDLTSAW